MNDLHGHLAGVICVNEKVRVIGMHSLCNFKPSYIQKLETARKKLTFRKKTKARRINALQIRIQTRITVMAVITRICLV